MIYDVIVVGAGPAGSTAAFQLAAKNQSVLIIDQDHFPRYKPCGGGLPMRTLAEIPFDVTPVLEFSAGGGMVTFRGKPGLKTPLNGDFAWLADRTKLDAFLLQKACDAGAKCITGMRVLSVREETDQVIVMTSDQTFSGLFLIGADGVNSITSKELRLIENRNAGIALEAELAVPAANLQEHGTYALFDFGALPYGYGWIFPKQDHLSVGIFQARNTKSGNLRANLENFIACQPVLRGHKILHMQGHRIPLGGQNGALHSKRSLLVGDAANLADPWLGGGVYYAIRSANLAAGIIQQAEADGNADLSDYTRRIRDEILTDFDFSRRIANIIYRFPRLATTLISRSKAMQEMVFLNIRGDLSFRQLWRQLILKMPIILKNTIIPNKEGLL